MKDKLQEFNNEYTRMHHDILTMDKEEMMKHVHALGCPLTYEEIVEKLKNNFNEDNVSNMIFDTYKIDDENYLYPIDFIDEAILQIITRFEKFPFTHYGLIAEEMIDYMEAEMSDEDKIGLYEESFRKFFKLCKYFKIEDFNLITFGVDSQLDLYGVIIDYLDECMEKGRMNNLVYFQKIIDFCTRFKKQFKRMNPFLEYSVDVQLASVYVALKDAKGEKMFLDLLKTHHDKTEAVLHYGLAYIDDDEMRTLKIFKRYRSLMSKESDCYEIIEQIISDCTNQ